MELVFRNSFFRDYDNISSREPNRALESLIGQIAKAQTLSAIPRLKQLKHTNQYEYKIELRAQSKIYWILCDLKGARLEFVRIKPETWCKKNL